MAIVEDITVGDGTCCCGGVPCVCQTCPICQEVFRRNQRYACAWIYEGEGFGDGNSPCTVLNGTFRMTPSGSCRWTYTDLSRTIVWQYNDALFRWELLLTADGVTTLVYGIVGPDWNCCGTNFPILLEDPPVGFCGAYGSVVVRPETVNDECPCPPDPCVCFPCPLCDNRAQQFPCHWDFVGTGFLDGLELCSRFNRTVRLAMTASCYWLYDDPTDLLIDLNLDGATVTVNLYLYSPPGNAILVGTYSRPVDAWNCCGNNTLNLTTNGNVCSVDPQGLPSTITLQPVTPCGCGGSVVRRCDCDLPRILFGTVTNSTCPCLPNGTVITFDLAQPTPPWDAAYQTGCGGGGAQGRLNFLLRCHSVDGECPSPGSCLGSEPPYVPQAWCLLVTCADPLGSVTNNCVVEGYRCSPTLFIFDIQGGDGGDEFCWGSQSCTFRLTLTP